MGNSSEIPIASMASLILWLPPEVSHPIDRNRYPKSRIRLNQWTMITGSLEPVKSPSILIPLRSQCPFFSFSSGVNMPRIGGVPWRHVVKKVKSSRCLTFSDHKSVPFGINWVGNNIADLSWFMILMENCLKTLLDKSSCSQEKNGFRFF